MSQLLQEDGAALLAEDGEELLLEGEDTQAAPRMRPVCCGPHKGHRGKPRHWVFVEVGKDGKPKRGRKK